MNHRFKESLIKRLTTELEDARKINAEGIAAEIRNIGFSCLMCGRCCRREHGDNSVIISPAEIQDICLHTGLDHDSVAQPPLENFEDLPDRKKLEDLSELIDIQGNIHTFGWELSRNKNGDCKFIQDISTGNKCVIYAARPLLCSTYPFHIEEGELKVSQCEGLGKEIGSAESLELASDLIERYYEELKETILLYENYESFKSGPENINKAMENIREGIINYVVHDSTGSHRTTRNIS
ncbi:YkgJ family cysteine cluster protein [Methanolobus sp.]|uniref:YkgJ family cysteine cluster protein n=1 Tax=Methanolobus sp. TaxID=1874737 RepID=UPI0025CCC385|nr:YkgJ family cysteine cluster protein [Methanolobus sp.]